MPLRRVPPQSDSATRRQAAVMMPCCDDPSCECNNPTCPVCGELLFGFEVGPCCDQCAEPPSASERAAEESATDEA